MLTSKIFKTDLAALQNLRGRSLRQYLIAMITKSFVLDTSRVQDPPLKTTRSLQ